MMDYKQMAEIVTKEVDAILERKKRRAILIKRISITASGLCAAAIVGIGVWHSRNIKPSLEHSDIPVISETSETTQQSDTAVTETVTTASSAERTSVITTAKTTAVRTETYAKTSSAVGVIAAESTASGSAAVTHTTAKQTAASSSADRADTATVSGTTKTDTTVLSTAATNTSVTTKIATTTVLTVTYTTTTKKAVTSTVYVPPRTTENSTKLTTRPIITTTAAVIIPGTTEVPQTTTVPVDDEEYSFTFRFIEYQRNRKKTIPGINVRLYSTPLQIIKDSGYTIFYYGTPKIIAEWNTTDTPEFTTPVFTEKNVQYYITTDDLPEGYNQFGYSRASYGFNTYHSGNNQFDYELDHGEPTIKRVDIPLKGTYSVDVSVENKTPHKLMEGLDCEVYERETGKVIAKWNTSDTEVMHIDGLEYEFDNNDRLSNTGKKIYNFRITNLPANFIYSDMSNTEEDYHLCGNNIRDFDDGYELKKAVKLRLILN